MRAALFGLAMLALAFAAVPLYRVFCQVTGFGGTTMKAEAAPGAVAGQIGVRFDANISPTLPWKFEPEQATVRIHPGARTTIYYHGDQLHRAQHHRARRSSTSRPRSAGKYFSKIECFCFTEQMLKPRRERADAGGVLSSTPSCATTPTPGDIDEITLSYTFYPVENPESGR